MCGLLLVQFAHNSLVLGLVRGRIAGGTQANLAPNFIFRPTVIPVQIVQVYFGKGELSDRPRHCAASKNRVR